MPVNAVIDAKNYANYNSIIPYIRYCAEDKYRQPWELRKRRISDYELLFITEGTGRFTIADCEYPAKPNDLVLFRPNVYHSGVSHTLPFAFLCIHFDLYVSEMADRQQIMPRHIYESVPAKPVKYYKASLDHPEYVPIRDSSFIHLLFRRIINEAAWQHAGFNSVIKSIFIDLLVHLFRQQSGMPVESIYTPEIQTVIDYIEKNHRKRIYLPELAALVHLQPAYLSGLFKKKTGHSITDIIKYYRISSAKSLLLETDRKVDDIANSVGFYDLHHFSRVFKEREGLTPVQYRQIKR